MKLLALETSTDACSVALAVDGDITVDTRIAPRQHTNLILGMIQQILSDSGIAKQQLDAIAYGRGPGAFTGLRIAAGVVQGLAYALNLPVVPVSTLAVMAQLCYQKHQHPDVLVAMDARMNEVYTAYYQYNGESMCLLDEERVVPPEKINLQQSHQCFGAGSGFLNYETLLNESRATLIGVDETLLPDAGALAALAVQSFARGETCAADKALPVYIRNNVAVKPSQQ